MCIDLSGSHCLWAVSLNTYGRCSGLWRVTPNATETSPLRLIYPSWKIDRGHFQAWIPFNLQTFCSAKIVTVEVFVKEWNRTHRGFGDCFLRGYDLPILDSWAVLVEFYRVPMICIPLWQKKICPSQLQNEESWIALFYMPFRGMFIQWQQ